MGPHLLKLIDTTIEFLQYFTSVFLIVLTANGTAFYYYWTNRSDTMRIKDFWPFAVSAGIVLGAFVFIGITYANLIDSLSEGIIRKYMEFWFKWVGLILWPALIGSILFLIISFIMVHKRSENDRK